MATLRTGPKGLHKCKLPLGSQLFLPLRELLRSLELSPTPPEVETLARPDIARSRIRAKIVVAGYHLGLK